MLFIHYNTISEGPNAKTVTPSDNARYVRTKHLSARGMLGYSKNKRTNIQVLIVIAPNFDPPWFSLAQ